MNTPNLNEGEIYVGIVGDAAGNLHHVILLPGDNDDANWKDQMAWAKSIGGDLPTRIEQAMLRANHRDQFKQDVYWSNEPHHAEPGWAWYQAFYDGEQYFYHDRYAFRARAVRRVVIDVSMSAMQNRSTLTQDEIYFAQMEYINLIDKQRDDLLEAMQKAADEIRKCDYTPARSTLLTAIAKAKGGAA